MRIKKRKSFNTEAKTNEKRILCKLTSNEIESLFFPGNLNYAQNNIFLVRSFKSFTTAVTLSIVSLKA